MNIELVNWIFFENAGHLESLGSVNAIQVCPVVQTAERLLVSEE